MLNLTLVNPLIKCMLSTNSDVRHRTDQPPASATGKLSGPPPRRVHIQALEARSNEVTALPSLNSPFPQPSVNAKIMLPPTRTKACRLPHPEAASVSIRSVSCIRPHTPFTWPTAPSVAVTASSYCTAPSRYNTIRPSHLIHVVMCCCPIRPHTASKSLSSIPSLLSILFQILEYRPRRLRLVLLLLAGQTLVHEKKNGLRT